MYSDVNLTNETLTDKLYSSEPDNEFIELKKGTYYLVATTDRLFSYEEINIKYGAYFGYVPKDKQFIGLSPSTKKATNQDVTVKVSVNEDCKQMWMIAEEAPDYMLDNEFYWTSDHVLTSNEFTASKNGIYTVRILDTFGNLYTKYITIDNIDTDQPAIPIVTRYYANSRRVSGTAEKGSTVYIVIGSTTYKATASKNSGYYSVTTAKLKKGTKIRVYCQDKAGNRSGSKTVRVK